MIKTITIVTLIALAGISAHGQTNGGESPERQKQIWGQDGKLGGSLTDAAGYVWISPYEDYLRRAAGAFEELRYHKTNASDKRTLREVLEAAYMMMDRGRWMFYRDGLKNAASYPEVESVQWQRVKKELEGAEEPFGPKAYSSLSDNELSRRIEYEYKVTESLKR